MPDAASLKKVRQEIDYCYKEFKSIITAEEFRSIYGDIYKGTDVSLSTNPKGYDKANSAIEYLKLKCFIAEKHFEDVELTKATLHQKTVAAFEALKPLLLFINRAIENVSEEV
jgi:uncharacterized protein (DUF2461 family)